ncbi:MAG: 3-deoxy-7-phosphoheptulonate synthase [Spirochaetales bacterium]|nr:3-deoxy-7-phosphoheptulonate synthase [Spirochaetales bacterium]
MENTSDVRILSCDLLPTPDELKKEFPISETAADTVLTGRRGIEAILAGIDSRMFAVVGPCSIHDPKAALEYAEKLAALQKQVRDKIQLVMRVYFEKPRTTVGWRGLILDPDIDGTGNIKKGLRIARKLLIDITSMGIPVGSEMLDPIVPQYIADLISWASIGARTTESQTHREMASGLSMPVGFKNGTDGEFTTAVNAMVSSITGHSFLGIDQQGRTAVLKTKGNKAVHLILRGGRSGPNYYLESVERAEMLLEKEKVPKAIVLDCSHANAAKQPERQARVLRAFLQNRKEGHTSLVGVMLESNLMAGCQVIPADKSSLVYGQSITDPCIGWETTESLLLEAYQTMQTAQ